MAEFEHIKPIIGRVIESLKVKAEDYKFKEETMSYKNVLNTLMDRLEEIEKKYPEVIKGGNVENYRKKKIKYQEEVIKIQKAIIDCQANIISEGLVVF